MRPSSAMQVTPTLPCEQGQGWLTSRVGRHVYRNSSAHCWNTRGERWAHIFRVSRLIRRNSLEHRRLTDFGVMSGEAHDA